MAERAYPVKHGVRVFGTSSWFIPVARRDENWELQPGTTWQVRRSDFDAMMLEEAQKRGATLVRGTATKALTHGRRGRARSDHGATGWYDRGHRGQGGSGLFRNGDFPRQPKGDRTEIRWKLRQANRFFCACKRCRPRQRNVRRNREGQHPYLLQKEISLVMVYPGGRRGR